MKEASLRLKETQKRLTPSLPKMLLEEEDGDEYEGILTSVEARRRSTVR